jgi:hypothetical protein
LSWLWLLIALLGCKTAHHSLRGESNQQASNSAESEAVMVEMPPNNPPERDDPKAPVLRVELRGPRDQAVAVPYLYGYPLYAEDPAIHGLRMLRQENWAGYEREVHKEQDGVIRVVESFPELGCVFEGVQEDEGAYVPFSMECNLPPPKKRGGYKRPVVGEVLLGARADSVPKEESLAKAFFGDWHATTAGFDGNNGAGYFDTAHGLLGFGFKKGRLTSVGFVFDPPEKRWRSPELWAPPKGAPINP